MGDYSMISTNHKTMTKSLSTKLADNNHSSNSQESGWTFYLEDFFMANNKHDKMNEHQQYSYSFCSDYHDQTSSMVSDAAFGDDDQELKDTATSSSTSRTQCFNNVNGANHLKAMSKVHQDIRQIFYQASKLKHSQNEQLNDNCNNYRQENGESGPKQAEEGTNMETLLKRKGLCLVPITLLLNYLK